MKNKLSFYRRQEGLTQKELAEKLSNGTEEISQKSISAWERGRRTPRPQMMQKLEDIFNVDKELIFFEVFSYSK